MQNLTLNNGVQLPTLGLGVFQTPPDGTVACRRAALDLGYRHIDTAAAYGNEREVGRALHDSGVPRETSSSKPRSGSATTATARPCAASTRAPPSSASIRSTC